MSSQVRKSFPMNFKTVDCEKVVFIHFHLSPNYKIQGIKASTSPAEPVMEEQLKGQDAKLP